MSSIGNNYTPFYVTDSDLEPTLRARATALSYMSNRNRIINGSMMIDQRSDGLSVSVPTTGLYTVDRWLVAPSGSPVSVQRVFTSNNMFVLRTTGAPGNTGVTVSQRIENLAIMDLVGRTVTVSALISSTTLGSIKLQYVTPGSLNNYSSNVPTDVSSVNITPTLARYSWTFTVPALAVQGLAINFVTGAFPSGTLDITNVQLEEGSQATPFERRLLNEEISACFRYYQTSKSSGNLYFTGYCSNGNDFRAQITLPVLMRASPTITRVDLGAFGFPAGPQALDAGVGYVAEMRRGNSNQTPGFFATSWTASAEL